MAFDGDDLDAAPAVRQRGKRSALLIGLLLTLLGAAILIGPLLYVMYTDPAGEEAARSSSACRCFCSSRRCFWPLA